MKLCCLIKLLLWLLLPSSLHISLLNMSLDNPLVDVVVEEGVGLVVATPHFLSILITILAKFVWNKATQLSTAITSSTIVFNHLHHLYSLPTILLCLPLHLYFPLRMSTSIQILEFHIISPMTSTTPHSILLTTLVIITWPLVMIALFQFTMLAVLLCPHIPTISLSYFKKI